MSVVLPAAFVNRTVDLVVFHSVNEITPAIETLDTGNNGAICTGVRKLAQLVEICLITPVGSLAYDRSFGTNLVQDVRTGVIRTTAALNASFATALQDVETWFSQNADLNAPLDEQLDTLVSVDAQLLGNGVISLRYGLTTAAGATVELAMPLTIEGEPA